MTNCVKKCCCNKKEEDEELTLENQCVVKAGIYKNVNIEVNEECRIVSLTPAQTQEVFLCDPCKEA